MAYRLDRAEPWDAVFRSPNREALEAALPGFVAARRWFGAKTRGIRAIRIREAIPILPSAALALLRVEYAEGAADLYALPIGFLAGPAARALQAEQPAAVIAGLSTDVDDGVLYDAAWDPAFCTALLEAIARQQRYAGADGDLVATASSAFSRLRGEDRDPLAPALLGVEQSNTSIRYGERLILKLYRRLEAGVNPDQEIGLFLTERAAFANTPAVAGVLEFRPRQAAAEPVTLALLQGFVPNRGDAWRYTLDALADYFAAARSAGAWAAALPQAPLGELVRGPIPADAERHIGAYLGSARLLGRRTAELHLALAADSGDPAFAAEPFTPDFQAYLRRSMRELVERTLRLLRARLAALPEPDQDDARRVLAHEPQIIGRFDALLARPIRALRMRIHGDYHLGQVLYTGDDFMIIDFEGEPARPLSERRMKRPPLQDVASMLRSFHYAAYAACFAQDGPPAAGLEAWARYWHLWVSMAYLQAYLAAADGAAFMPAADDLKLLLDIYLVEKAIYELGYELNNRPGWVKIPLQGILQTVQAG
ncbi:MAG: Maltokinase [Chloroflexi bacterium ADurb.Bin325]|nr:MAG: Maltokinase [Chloroflexi bacterium ADurb.Bin325]